MITISIDTSKFDRAMADFPAALARAQRVALVKIGNIVENRARGAIKDPSLRPSPWAPRKKDYKHPPLLKSTSMWRGINYKVTGPDTVVVGTPYKYAGYHQRGTKNMTARPFFPVDGRGRLMPDVMDAIVREVQDVYSAESQKAFGNGGG